MEYYSVLKKNEIMVFAGKWMEPGNIIISKINQPKNTKRQMFSCDMWIVIHNGSERTLDWAEGSEGRKKEWGWKRWWNETDIIILCTCMIA